MYRTSLADTALGMILLYTAVNISLAVWLLKGFIDEIPRSTRRPPWSTAIPPAGAGKWSCRKPDRHRRDGHLLPDLRLEQYAFVLLLTSGTAQTAPPYIPLIIGEGGLDWPVVAAAPPVPAALVFFTVVLRNQPLRGITWRSAQMTRPATRSGMAFLPARPWENAATAAIAAGVFMLMQPFSLDSSAIPSP